MKIEKEYDLKNAEDAMTVLRNEMYGFDMTLLAVRVGVTPSCLFAIRRGKTKWPRAHTFFGLISVLGLELYLQKKVK